MDINIFVIWKKYKIEISENMIYIQYWSITDIFCINIKIT